MVRITCTTTDDGRLTAIKVEGRLVDTAIDELARVAEAAFARGQRLRLELSGVTYADRAGAALLRRLVDRGAALDGASVFLHGAIYGG